MHKLIRWYNQNRMGFWIIISVIAFGLIMIHVLNDLVGEENAQKKNNLSLENSSTIQSTTISEPDTSVITGESVSKETTKKNETVIKEFIDYCNNGEVDKAYDMLSEECKSLVYPSVQYFNENYYQKIFYINRMYKLESWYPTNRLYTYYITYTEDVLATGKTKSEDNRADYITVVKNENGYKLNISSYIGRIMSKKVAKENNIVITVNWLDFYMDYIIANISVKNNNSDAICLDTREEDKNTYIYDENGVKYTGLLNENVEEQLIIRRGMTNTLNIKFNKIYDPDIDLCGIVFSDVVLNYEKYTSKAENKNKIAIKVEI